MDPQDWCSPVAMCLDCQSLPLCAAHLPTHQMKKAHKHHRIEHLPSVSESKSAESQSLPSSSSTSSSSSSQSIPMSSVKPPSALSESSMFSSPLSPSSSLPPSSSTSSSSAPIEKPICCSIHSCDPLNILCQDCQSVICMLCALSPQHRHHSTISIPGELMPRYRRMSESFSARSRWITLHADEVCQQVEVATQQLIKAIQASSAQTIAQVRKYESEQLEIHAQHVRHAEQLLVILQQALQSDVLKSNSSPLHSQSPLSPKSSFSSSSSSAATVSSSPSSPSSSSSSPTTTTSACELMQQLLVCAKAPIPDFVPFQMEFVHMGDLKATTAMMTPTGVDDFPASISSPAQLSSLSATH